MGTGIGSNVVDMEVGSSGASKYRVDDHNQERDFKQLTDAKYQEKRTMFSLQ